MKSRRRDRSLVEFLLVSLISFMQWSIGASPYFSTRAIDRTFRVRDRSWRSFWFPMLSREFPGARESLLRKSSTEWNCTTESRHQFGFGHWTWYVVIGASSWPTTAGCTCTYVSPKSRNKNSEFAGDTRSAGITRGNRYARAKDIGSFFERVISSRLPQKD